MQKYIGVKAVLAKKMTLGDYNKLRGWEMPAQEEPETEGYLVEYLDGGKANHPDFLGYISWCPKEQFENANRPVDHMTFGHAIEVAKQGARIARAGWNGKDMFVVYQPGYPEGIPCNANTAAAFGYELGELFKCRPYLQMRCADGTHQMWLASQSDILEEDWVIV
jgi:hypothetical protein